MHRVLLIAPLLVACGSFGSAYDARATVAEATCERAFACAGSFPEGDEADFDTLYGASAEACVARLGPDPAQQDAWKEAEKSLVLTYDATLARACRDAIEAASCEAFWSTEGFDACDGFVAGTVAKDARCSFDEQCTSGLCRDGYCD